MLFVIDIGNSHTVTGLYNKDILIGQWRMKSDRNSTEDEIAIQYRSLFKMAGIEQDQITAIVLASVVPTLETVWVSCCQKHFRNLHRPVITVSDKSVSDMITVQLPNPGEVGADRLVNAIAGFQQFATNLIVIDLGTAITLDCVTARREYIGGVILPGIAISLDALAQRTAKLPWIDVSNPPSQIICSTTVEAMKSGILHGYGAMMNGLVDGISKELREKCDNPVNVIATGGMARVIAPYCGVIDHIDPMLTLTGLKVIYDTKNR